MNILFVTSAAPAKSPFSTLEKRPPLGLGSIISVVRSEGNRVHFIDNYLQPSSFIEEGFLQKNSIDFIGIYVNTICFRDSLRMFNAIEDLRREGLWQGKIMAGGPHTSVAPETIPGFVDYVVQGEGEGAVLDIIEGKVSDRMIRKEKIAEPDTLPFLPWDLFTVLPYQFTCPWMDLEPVFTMNTSRGCPFNCSFCSVGSIWGRQYTYFSAGRIIAEIQYLMEKYGAKGIYFREDNFTLNTNRTFEFCEKLLQKGINISWACETRVDNLSRELIGVMAKAGCEAFYLGIESGSQRMLDFLNKNVKVEQIEKVLGWSKSSGIKTYCSLITGIPGESYIDYLKTLRLMNKLKPYSYNFNIYVGLADSQLYHHVRENKLYEHEDDIGLLYLPGFDVKTRFFYNMKSEQMVDYKFRKRTLYDRLLLIHYFARKVKNFTTRKIKNFFYRK